MSRPAVSIMGAALDGLRIVAGSLRRYRPGVAAVVHDPAATGKWRRMVETADRFDVFPADEDTPIPYTLTDKASA